MEQIHADDPALWAGRLQRRQQPAVAAADFQKAATLRTSADQLAGERTDDPPARLKPEVTILHGVQIRKVIPVVSARGGSGWWGGIAHPSHHQVSSRAFMG
jgi:hypothetical protein